MLLVFAGAMSPSVANDSIVPEDENEFAEPVVTEETMPTEVGEWDFRASTQFVRNGDEATTVLPSLSLSRGLTQRLSGEFGVPFVYREDAERNYEIETFVGLLKTVGPATVQGSVGWSVGVPKSEGTTSHSVTYNRAVSLPVWRDQTYAMIDLNGGIGTRNAEDTVAVAPGLRHSWKDGVSVAIAVPIGLNDNTADWALPLDWRIEF